MGCCTVFFPSSPCPFRCMAGGGAPTPRPSRFQPSVILTTPRMHVRCVYLRETIDPRSDILLSPRRRGILQFVNRVRVLFSPLRPSPVVFRRVSIHKSGATLAIPTRPQECCNGMALSTVRPRRALRVTFLECALRFAATSNTVFTETVKICFS